MRIDPATGLVLERMEAGGLLTASEADGADVLNGIAHNPSDGTFYITGKRWPKLFKVASCPRARDDAPALGAGDELPRHELPDRGLDAAARVSSVTS